MAREDSGRRVPRFFETAKKRFSDLSPNDFQLIPSLSRLPNLIRRKIRNHEGSSLLTMFPVMAVLVSLVFTVSLLPLSLIHI